MTAHYSTAHYSAARLTLALLSVLTLAGPAAARGQEKQVPFRGVLEGTATVAPLAPPFVAVDIEASGHATHLGNFDVSIPHVANRSNGTAVGTYVFTAANGDTLTADFTSRVTPTDVLGVVSVAVTATITGGTGRFEGATGSFVGDRLVDMAHGTVTESFDGTISTPR
jgi:hypothetical protein